MKTKLLSREGDLRTIAVVFEPRDEVQERLLAFARADGVSAAAFTGIGAFERLTIGYYALDRGDYQRIAINEQVEALALTGNIALGPTDVRLHAHVVVGRADGTAYGGHLLEAIVRPTLEVIVTETPAHLRRRMDSATGLPLIDLDA